MTPQTTNALVGLLAGAAAAFLLLSAGQPSFLSLFLYSAASLPIMIAGIGWSNRSSVVAVVTAFGLIAAFANPLAAGVAAITTLAPAAWLSHLATLARPAEEVGGPQGLLAWYPLDRILMHLAGLVSASIVILGVVIGYGPELASGMVDMLVEQIRTSEPAYQPSVEGITQMKAFFTVALPAAQGAIWVGILFATLMIALSIARRSGKTARPKDDIPSMLRLPRAAAFVFGAAFALSFVPGAAGLVAWVVIGAFGMALTLVGFAVMHERTRGRPMRAALLWLAYLAVLMFTLPLLLFLMLGLADALKQPTSPRSST